MGKEITVTRSILKLEECLRCQNLAKIISSFSLFTITLTLTLEWFLYNKQKSDIVFTALASTFCKKNKHGGRSFFVEEGQILEKEETWAHVY